MDKKDSGLLSLGGAGLAGAVSAGAGLGGPAGMAIAAGAYLLMRSIFDPDTEAENNQKIAALAAQTKADAMAMLDKYAGIAGDMTNASISDLKFGYSEAMKQAQPFIEAGKKALDDYNTGKAFSFDVSSVTKSPTFEFLRKEQESAMNRQLSARGLLRSGAGVRAQDRGYQEFLSKQTTDEYNRQLQSWQANEQRRQFQAGMGQSAAQMGSGLQTRLVDQTFGARQGMVNLLGGYGQQMISGTFGTGQGLMGYQSQSGLLDKQQAMANDPANVAGYVLGKYAGGAMGGTPK